MKRKIVRDNPDYFKSRKKKRLIKSVEKRKPIPKEKTSLELYMETIKTPSDYEGTEEFTRSLEPPIRDVYEKLNWSNDEVKNALLFLYERHRHKGAVLSDYRISTLNNVLHFTNNFDINVFPTIVIPYWRNLMQNNNVKIIFIFTKTYTSKNDGHATWTIVDKVRKKVEFFDPHGSYIIDDSNRTGYWTMDFVKVFRDTFLCKSKLSSTWCFIPATYKILEYKDSCLTIGFQGFEMNALKNENIDIRGYCIFWSLFFMDLRLSNLKMETKQVQEEFKKIITNDVKNMIIPQSFIDMVPPSVKPTQMMLRQKFKEFIRSYVLFLINISKT